PTLSIMSPCLMPALAAGPSGATAATTFFFSSRRRHTRLQGDWSSDVCSSDYAPAEPRGKYKSLPAVRSVYKAILVGLKHGIEARSEERRVGKECRCRWSAQH